MDDAGTLYLYNMQIIQNVLPSRIIDNIISSVLKINQIIELTYNWDMAFWTYIIYYVVDPEYTCYVTFHHVVQLLPHRGFIKNVQMISTREAVSPVGSL